MINVQNCLPLFAVTRKRNALVFGFFSGSDLDRSVLAYTELRKQLQDLPAHNPNYDEIELKLSKQIQQLKTDVDSTISAITEKTSK